MTILIDVEKAFEKIQHSFMVKTLSKLGREEYFLNLVKTIHKISRANSFLVVRNSKLSH